MLIYAFYIKSTALYFERIATSPWLVLSYLIKIVHGFQGVSFMSLIKSVMNYFSKQKYADYTHMNAYVLLFLMHTNIVVCT